MTMNIERTSDEWLAQPAFSGVLIMDPDGWDRKNLEQSWGEKITQREFESRMIRSTVQILPDSPMHPRNM